MRALLLCLAVLVAAPARAEEKPLAKKKAPIVFTDEVVIESSTPDATLIIPRNPQVKRDVDSAGGDALEKALERR